MEASCGCECDSLSAEAGLADNPQPSLRGTFFRNPFDAPSVLRQVLTKRAAGPQQVTSGRETPAPTSQPHEGTSGALLTGL
ncbi:hypothetical protein NDU88_002602 [Pleurodeles waltl]|uniref:Uncharacterized protein n=1 Tax=Pleurodeles waltl TaxID=8319 RepID=A0AAV7LCS7_PLEWA|nr:hypothetical protein NDU88_002602 [Pleurodeles waltl]